MKEIKIIKIMGDDFLLCIITLQLDSYHPLDGLLQQALQLTMSSLRIQLFGQLLGDSRTTTSTLLPQKSTFYNSTAESNKVYA